MMSTITPKNDIRYKRVTSASKSPAQLEGRHLSPVPLSFDSNASTPVGSPTKTRRRMRGADSVVSRMPSRRTILGAVFALFIVAAVITGLYLTKGKFLLALLHWVKTLGLWGNVIIAGIFVLLGLPFFFGYFVAAIAAGFLFGLRDGVITVAIGCALGAMLGFVAARNCARDIIHNSIIKKKQAFQVMLEVINQHGFKVIFMIRLVPIPFGIANSIFGVSNVNPVTYLIATVSGLLPFQLVFIYMGTTARSLAEIVSGNVSLGKLQIAILAGQVTLSIVFIIFVVLVARRMMSRASKNMVVDEEKGSEGEDEDDPESSREDESLLGSQPLDVGPGQHTGPHPDNASTSPVSDTAIRAEASPKHTSSQQPMYVTPGGKPEVYTL
eukprot:TRINITY_DN3985_c0_g1_i6.p1 TRINITY_DN3985_c0_g1~~TRINITY_DN3985_c0_g1_i6.p1  ORF type:complete len:383 (+),score=68.15 TRINITY_DN3985_c0_g1_i6:123-1271(+)